MDNCYIKQYGTHPTIRDQSANCRALCVVEIPCRLPYFIGHPTIHVLIGSIGNVAAALVRTKRSFRGLVRDLGLFVDRPSPIPSIRAQLDIVRDLVRTPGWRPLLLTTHQVSWYKGLIELLHYIASLSIHTHPIMPILLDENMHKRCLKLLYCDKMNTGTGRKNSREPPFWTAVNIPINTLSQTCGGIFIPCLCTSALTT